MVDLLEIPFKPIFTAVVWVVDDLVEFWVRSVLAK